MFGILRAILENSKEGIGKAFGKVCREMIESAWQ
jgi:hypothetical protein